MKRTFFFLPLWLMAFSSCAPQPSRNDIMKAMKEATAYMMDSVSVNGGFVWNVTADGQRRWGEMEAYPTMIWLQAPATPEVGETLLEAFQLTGDDFYYRQARRVADAVMDAQLPCGGWNYLYDYAGEESTRQWYATIGRSAWRLEEFQHYYGNATFDDAVSTSCAGFLLRCWLAGKDAEVKSALDKAIAFVLESQYENGGWPQRYPLMYDHPFRGRADYTSFVTLNDDVVPDCIAFLESCREASAMDGLDEPIDRARKLMVKLQQPAPLAGWADQYTPADLKPAHARSYEPRSVNTGTTVRTINLLLEYYRKTGDTTFLEGIPAALDFLESMRLPDDQVAVWGRPARDSGAFLVPRFIDPDTGRPLYVHRVGSNVYNGYYYCDESLEGTIGHYSSATYVNTDRLRQRYEEAVSRVDAPLAQAVQHRWPEPTVKEVLRSLEGGRWMSPLSNTSNPWTACDGDGSGSDETAYRSTNVGDRFDTSPYTCPADSSGQVPECISTRTYLINMRVLMNALEK